MTQPRFVAIGLPVADMGRSLAFYRTLGLDVPDGAETAPHAEIQLAAGVKLMLDTIDSIAAFDPGWTKPESGQANLAFDCGGAAGVDRAYAQMTAAGYRGHLEPWDAFWGQRYSVVLDPDGNGIDLFAALPGATPPGP